MKEITLKAYAKINLALDVLGKLPNGYHQVKMVMQQINLFDTVSVAYRELPGGETAICGATSRGDLPMDESNIAHKAAMLMKKTYRPEAGCEIRITIDKKIPMAAGLAGGSADGAAVMRALARLWELNVSPQDLAALSAQIGADVPFCLMGQEGQFCALAEGIGEQLSPVRPLSAWVMLSKPPVCVPTKEVYANLCLDECQSHPDIEQMIKGLDTHNLPLVTANMENLLESAALRLYPEIVQTKEAIEQLRTAGAVLMSGSGPTVFGIYMNQEKAKSAYRIMKQKNAETYLVKTLG